MIPVQKVYTGLNEGLTAVICGSAPCLLKNYLRIQRTYSNFITIGVNEAVQGLYCDKLITAHPDQIPYFVSRSINKDIETHTSKHYRQDLHDTADYFWTDIKKGATSGIDALQVARKMGFTKIILVGMPMNGEDGYFFAEEAQENIEDCPRFGNKGNDRIVARHQTKLCDIIEGEDYSNVSSVNGYTAYVFGTTILKD